MRRRRQVTLKVPAWHLRQHYAQRRVRCLPGWQAAARAERHGMPRLRARVVLLGRGERSSALPKRDTRQRRPTSGAPRSASSARRGAAVRSARRRRRRAQRARILRLTAANGARCARQAGSRVQRELPSALAAGQAASARWARAASCRPTASLAAMATSRMRMACPTASTARLASRVPAGPRG